VRQPLQVVTKNLDANQQKNPDLNATRLKPKKGNKMTCLFAKDENACL
jgi:hypothetical protein